MNTPAASHGGYPGLLRSGARSLAPGVEINTDRTRVRYGVEPVSDGTFLGPATERLDEEASESRGNLVRREGAELTWGPTVHPHTRQAHEGIASDATMLSAFGCQGSQVHPAPGAVATALRSHKG